jgi:hypothetical protein
VALYGSSEASLSEERTCISQSAYPWEGQALPGGNKLP